MGGNGTKERLLDAAERLFAERGFAGTSVRVLTGAARANLGAVQYHFGGKEALFQAVVDRRVGPIQKRRLALLDELEARGDGAPALEAVLRSLVAPAFELERPPGEVPLRSIIGRLYSEPLDLVEPVAREEFSEVTRRYGAALGRVLPGLPESEIWWRYQFATGALLHVLSGNASIAPRPGPREDEPPEVLVERMVAFLAAGMRGPPAAAGVA